MTCRAIKSVLTAEKRKLRKCNMFGTKCFWGGATKEWKSGTQKECVVEYFANK